MVSPRDRIVDDFPPTRAFVVGCPRSGTTLVQAMLAAHSQIWSCPETHFFRKVLEGGAGHGLPFGLIGSRRARAALCDVLQLLQRPDLKHWVGSWRPDLDSHVRVFGSILDRAAWDSDKPLWIEKTPDHLRHIACIGQAFPGTRFLHVLRDGRDVVASLYQAAQQDPNAWGAGTRAGQGTWPLARCVRRWNEDVHISLAYRRDPDHLLILYEDLVTEPSYQLGRICRFLGVSFEPGMLEHWRAAEEILGTDADPWRTDIRKPLRPTHLVKFRSVLEPEERRWAERHLIYGGRIEVLWRALTEGGL